MILSFFNTVQLKFSAICVRQPTLQTWKMESMGYAWLITLLWSWVIQKWNEILNQKRQVVTELCMIAVCGFVLRPFVYFVTQLFKISTIYVAWLLT